MTRMDEGTWEWDWLAGDCESESQKPKATSHRLWRIFLARMKDGEKLSR